MICTFYSYKGGVGRSMAMANVADILARRGLKVLMVDFDLEAPGLEQFFQINHDSVRRHLGLLDLLLNYKQSMSVAAGEDTAFRNLSNFICPIYERLPGAGRLDLMPAGQRQDAEQLSRYALNLRTFDWQDFYFKWEGELFFEWLRKSLAPRPYDLVLVDSRTGVTEMGGICGYQLADAIVMFCAANYQNVQGTANMLRDFRSSTVETLRRGRKLDIVIVPARIEERDPQLLDDFFRRFDEAFAGLVPETLSKAGIRFRDLTLPYEPQYAFEERVVSDPSRRTGGKPLVDAFDRLAEVVSLLAAGEGDQVLVSKRHDTGDSESTTSSMREAPAAAQYDSAKRFADYDVFIDCSGQDQEIGEAIANGLKSKGLRTFLDRQDMPIGADSESVIEQALFHNKVLVFCIGAQGLSEWRLRTLEKALQARKHGQIRAIIPVLLRGSDFSMFRETELASIQALDLRQEPEGSMSDRLYQSIVVNLPRKPKIEAESRMPFPGVRPFSEHERDLLFGREKQVQDLVSLVDTTQVVWVVGPSGSGKTSLVQAGLIPRLRAAQQRWTVVTGQVGSEPLNDFVKLLVHLSGPNKADDQKRMETLTQGHADRSVRIDEAIKAAAERASPGRLLVFIDEFEQLFSLCTDSSQRQGFVNALASTLGYLPRNVVIVIAMRADFLAQIRAFPDILKYLKQPHLFEIPSMTSEELRYAIERPVELVGAAFEPGLVERILVEIEKEPIALGLLQVVLLRLWNDRREGWLTNAAFDAVGGLRGLLGTEMENLYTSLEPKPNEQVAMRRIMLQLIGTTPSGQYIRRQIVLQALISSDTENTVATKLMDARLLILKAEKGEQVVELVHESVIRGWQRLRDWLDQDRAFLMWRERLIAAVQEWRTGHRSDDCLLRGAVLAEAVTWSQERVSDLAADEREFIGQSVAAKERTFRLRERRRKQVIAVLSVALLVSVAMSLFALSQRGEANRVMRILEEDLYVAEKTITELREAQATLRELTSKSEAAAFPANRTAEEEARDAEERRRMEVQAARQIQDSLMKLERRVEQNKMYDKRH